MTPRERFVEALREWIERDKSVGAYLHVHNWQFPPARTGLARQAIEAFADATGIIFADRAALLRACGLEGGLMPNETKLPELWSDEWIDAEWAIARQRPIAHRRLTRTIAVKAMEEAAAKMQEIADARGHHGSGSVRLFQEWCRARAMEIGDGK